MTNLLPKPFYLILELIDFQDFPRCPIFFLGLSLYQGRIQSLNELAYVYPHPLPPEGKTFFLCRGEGPATRTFIHSYLSLQPLAQLFSHTKSCSYLKHTPQEFQFKYRKICYELDLYIYPMASLTFSLLIMVK